MNNVLFSIITPSFNSEETIGKTLQSLLNQTYQNFEYIIIDGGSSDGTLNVIDRYKEKFGDKLTIVSEKDDGIYDAMNKGISLAKGQLIGIVNSDDFYEFDALENVAKEYQNEKYAVFYGMLRMLSGGKEQSVVFYNHEFLNKEMINHPSCFVTKSVYDDFGTYSLSYKSASDYEFMLRISQNPEVVFKPIYKIISNFAIGGISSSSTGLKETINLQYRYGGLSKKKYYFKKLYCGILMFFEKIGLL